MFSIFGIEEILDDFRYQFLRSHKSKFIGSTGRLKDAVSFDSIYEGILEAHMIRNARDGVKMSDQSLVVGSGSTRLEQPSSSSSSSGHKVHVSNDTDSDSGQSSNESSLVNHSNKDQMIAESKLDSSSSSSSSSEKKQQQQSKKPKKPSNTNTVVEKRVWRHDSHSKVSRADVMALDYSTKVAKATTSSNNGGDSDRHSSIHDDDDNNDDESSFSSVTTWFSGLMKRELTNADLAPILTNFSNKLIAKNVSYEISNKICENISANLIGKVVSSFESVSAIISASCSTSLSSILSNSNSSLLSQISSANSTPFVITIIGVNGVGKSTSLAKLAFYLKSHSKSVIIAACDTFRSGAIEQLQVHATRLGVELIQGKYGHDSIQVANSAISYATAHHIDVVLVDTAGRMQNNEPLLRSLNELIDALKPNLNIFVSEALVGNDGMNQLSLFNHALRSRINGLILTKMDAVGSKVGSALSLSFMSSIPILFIGNGQKYTHLKEFDEKMIVKALFED